jgi:hypothetical protein
LLPLGLFGKKAKYEAGIGIRQAFREGKVYRRESNGTPHAPFGDGGSDSGREMRQ